MRLRRLARCRSEDVTAVELKSVCVHSRVCPESFSREGLPGEEYRHPCSTGANFSANPSNLFSFEWFRTARSAVSVFTSLEGTVVLGIYLVTASLKTLRITSTVIDFKNRRETM